MTNFKYYNYANTGQVLTHKPVNTHLLIEADSDTLYYVDSIDETKLYKYVVSTDVESLITTRTKKIAREWFDRTNNKIYFVDCEYDGGTSYVWFLTLSDDSITEVKSFATCDILDIFKMGNDMMVQYFEAGGYTLEQGDVVPNGDILTQWEETPPGTSYTCIDESKATPDITDYIKMKDIITYKHAKYNYTTIDLSGYDSGQIYAIKIGFYAKADSKATTIYVYDSFTGSYTPVSGISMSWTWYYVNYTGLNKVQADLNALWIQFTTVPDIDVYRYVATTYCTIYFYGDSQNHLVVENLTDSSKDQNDMGSPVARTYDCSQLCVASDTLAYFLWNWSDENVEIWEYDKTAETFTQLEDCGANTELPAEIDRRGIIYDNDDIIGFSLYYNDDSKYYYCTYVISTDTFAKKGEYSIVLQMDRNCKTSNAIGFNLEKGFDIDIDANNFAHVYQISKRRGNLWLISVIELEVGAIVLAVSDTYLIVQRGDTTIDVFKYQDLMTYIVEWWVDHSKEDYPVAEVLLRSDYISVQKGMLMQLIGYYVANGKTMYYKHSPDSFNDETPKAITLAGDIDWIDAISLPNSCTCNLIETYDLHKNVLQLTHDGGANNPYVKHNFAVAQTAETYEFWWGQDDATFQSRVYIYNEGTEGIVLRINSDKYYYLDRSTVWIEIVGVIPTDGNLDHFKVVFDCATDTFDLHINSIERVTGGEFYQVATTLAYIAIIKYTNADSTYFSAPGEVWDATYVTGDNQYVAKGMPDQVCFEGIVKSYDAKTLRAVRLESPAKEMDQVKPSGSKAGRTDEIITDMSNDLNGISYVSMGALSVGAAMGTLALGGDKTWRTLVNNFKDMDTFTWYLTPTGELNYDNGEVSTGVAIRYDGTTYFDKIEDANGYFLAHDVNKVIVRGASGIESESTHGNNEADQQVNGVYLYIVRDASLNTVALCNSKADAIIARDTDIATIDAIPDMGMLGFVQPGQTFLFKFVTTDVVIVEDTFTIDRVKFEAKSEDFIIEASNGLFFEV